MASIVIVDIDGTLANTDHRIHLIKPVDGSKKKWHEFFIRGKDDPIFKHVTETVSALRASGYKIILLTGRPDNYRKVTEEWLAKHNIEYDALYMRPADSREEDFKVKEKIFWEICEGDKDKVLCVFEDRKAVIEMWRRIDVPIFICGDDIFEMQPDLKALAQKVLPGSTIENIGEIDNDQFYVVYIDPTGQRDYRVINKTEARALSEPNNS